MSNIGSTFDRITEECIKALEHEKFSIVRAGRAADKIIETARERMKVLSEFSLHVDELALGKLGHIFIGGEPIEVGERGAEYMSLRMQDRECRMADWLTVSTLPSGYYRAIVILQPTAAPKPRS